VALALVAVACAPAGDVPAADDRSPLVPTYDPAVADLDVADAAAWADLVAGTVARTGTGDVTVTAEFAAPPSSPQRGTTMNVASFHDLTGDGHVDLEFWANWSDAGWFPSWRDNRAGRAAYGRDTGISVRAQDATLELTIPAERFGTQDRWRWSLGLEWGRHEWLGTAAAAHDLAPDEGAVAHAP
jgi:hypothetical protein